MKKTLLMSALLMLGLIMQAQAASTDSNQNNTATGVQVQGNQAGNAVQVQEQNQVMNQGEDAQIQTQEQNSVQTQEQNQIKNQGEATQVKTQEKNVVKTQDGTANKASKSKSNSNSSEQRRSEVANAVQTMLQVADRDGGIGQQVRVIAQNQNQNQVKLEQNIEKIQSRGSFAKFFIGPNYGEIKDTQKTLEQNKEQIRQLNQVKNQLNNEGDQQQLTEQIRILEQANQEIETLLNDVQSGFSLFGWLNKLVS